MDIPQIVQTTITILTPVFPYLVKGAKTLGDKYVDEIGSEMAIATIEKAKNIWSLILSQTANDERNRTAVKKIEQSAQALSIEPDDVDWQAMFRNNLTRLLQNDPVFKKAISDLLSGQRSHQHISARNNESARIKQIQENGGQQAIIAENNKDIEIVQQHH